MAEIGRLKKYKIPMIEINCHRKLINIKTISTNKKKNLKKNLLSTDKLSCFNEKVGILLTMRMPTTPV